MNTDPVDPITFRNLKRKQPHDHQCDVSSVREDLAGLSKILTDFIASNNTAMEQMRTGISDLKIQMNEIKITQASALTAIQSKISEIETTSSKLTIEQNHMNTKLISLDEKVQAIEANVSELKKTTPEKSQPENKIYSNEEVIQEFQERNNRSKNIIIAGINEQSSKDSKERATKDLIEVKNIICHVIDDIQEPNAVFRIGKYNPGKTRRVKVCFDNDEPVKKLLRKKEKIPEGFKFYSDLTPKQQNFLDQLKSELLRRQNNGENNLKIKYVKGMPRIIEEIPKN
ncbi:hypothetical protein NE865_16392 [Phthorimaea operculella]|nr:hypothetical protein NE865_16392 [Phthorimaea operculella]